MRVRRLDGTTRVRGALRGHVARVSCGPPTRGPVRSGSTVVIGELVLVLVGAAVRGVRVVWGRSVVGSRRSRVGRATRVSTSSRKGDRGAVLLLGRGGSVELAIGGGLASVPSAVLRGGHESGSGSSGVCSAPVGGGADASFALAYWRVLRTLTRLLQQQLLLLLMLLLLLLLLPKLLRSTPI